jgi:hypothetical protein
MNNSWFSFGKLVTIAILSGLVFGGFGLWNYANEVRNTIIDFQTQLNARYKSNQNYLANYETGFYESIGVANLKSDKLDKILSDAAKGRYEGNTSAQPGKGALFSAIVEAWPDLDLAVYDKIVDYVDSGRAGYRNMQDVLIDHLRSFDKWRQEGILRSFIVRLAGFPNDDLFACAGPDDCKYGMEALRRMWDIVLTEDVENAYKTSKMKALKVTPEEAD